MTSTVQPVTITKVSTNQILANDTMHIFNSLFVCLPVWLEPKMTSPRYQRTIAAAVSGMTNHKNFASAAQLQQKQRFSKKKTKRTSYNRQQVSKRQRARDVMKEPQTASIGLISNPVIDLAKVYTPKTGIGRRNTTAMNQKQKSLDKLSLPHHSSSIQQAYAPVNTLESTSKIQTAKPPSGRKSIMPFVRAIELNQTASQKVMMTSLQLQSVSAPSQSPDQIVSASVRLSKKLKPSSRQTTVQNNYNTSSKDETSQISSDRDKVASEQLWNHQQSSSTMREKSSPQEENQQAKEIKLQFGGTKDNNSKGTLTPVRHLDLAAQNNNIHQITTQQDDIAVTSTTKVQPLYQMPVAQRLSSINQQTQQKPTRIRSFTDRMPNAAKREGSQKSLIPFQKSQVDRYKAKELQTQKKLRENGHPMIQLIQTIKPMGLKEVLKSPTSKSSFMISPSKLTSTKKSIQSPLKSPIKRSIVNEVFIDLTNSMVAHEQVLEKSPLTRVQSRSLLKIICYKQIVQHLSFRELSDLLQLCRKTRMSSTISKCQKQAYLILLKRGQIEMDGLNRGRCRMWFQRLNIQLSKQKEMKRRYKTYQKSTEKKSASAQIDNNDLETIEADLRRSQFTMPTSISYDTDKEKSLQKQIREVLEKLSAQLSFGYLQGMNYIVIALYRVTKSIDMTYALALKLLSNEKLTSFVRDETAQSMTDLCEQLRVYIGAYLPKLGQAMDKSGVEPDFFAQTWVITLLFHFQVNEQLKSRQRKVVSLSSQRVLESLVIDFLCLDNAKSLIKVPMCALAQLELIPHALEESSNKAVNTSPRYENKVHYFEQNSSASHSRAKLSFLRREQSFNSLHSRSINNNNEEQQSMTVTEDIDDECERLVATIKRSAAEYMSGYTQLMSSKFKKEVKASQSMFSFFQSQQSIENLEQKFIVRDFVETYKSFKVSDQLYQDLKAKEKSKYLTQDCSIDSNMLIQPQKGAFGLTTVKSGPISIIKNDYLTNIKQGALNTLNIGCNLFGFGGSQAQGGDIDYDGNTQNENSIKDIHHLSFDQDDSNKDGEDYHANERHAYLMNARTLNEQSKNTNHGASCKTLHSMNRPSNLIAPPSKKLGSAQTKLDLTLTSLQKRKTSLRQKRMMSIEKQLQVSGDAESFELTSALTIKRDPSHIENAGGGNSTMIILDSTDPPCKPGHDSITLNNRGSIQVTDFNPLALNTRSVIIQKQASEMIEDVIEADEHAMISNKIRITNIKGSHTVLAASSNDRDKNQLDAEIEKVDAYKDIEVAAMSPLGISERILKRKKIQSPTVASSSVSKKPQCTFEKIPQFHKGVDSLSHPKSKALFEKTLSKERLGLPDSQASYPPVVDCDLAITLPSQSKLEVHHSYSKSQAKASESLNSKLVKSAQKQRKTFLEIATSPHKQVLNTEECDRVNQAIDTSLSLDMQVIEEKDIHNQPLLTELCDAQNQRRRTQKHKRQPSEKTVSIHSPNLALQQSHSSFPNIRGLQQILNKSGTTRYSGKDAATQSQKMFKKKKDGKKRMTNNFIRTKVNSDYADSSSPTDHKQHSNLFKSSKPVAIANITADNSIDQHRRSKIQLDSNKPIHSSNPSSLSFQANNGPPPSTVQYQQVIPTTATTSTQMNAKQREYLVNAARNAVLLQLSQQSNQIASKKSLLRTSGQLTTLLNKGTTRSAITAQENNSSQRSTSSRQLKFTPQSQKPQAMSTKTNGSKLQSQKTKA